MMSSRVIASELGFKIKFLKKCRLYLNRRFPSGGWAKGMAL